MMLNFSSSHHRSPSKKQYDSDLDDFVSSHDGDSVIPEEEEVDGSSSSGSNNAQDAQEDKLAAKETVMVNRSKIAVVLVVFVAAVASGTVTYIFMENEKEGWVMDEVRAYVRACM